MNRSAKTLCSCGGQYRYSDKAKHFRTKRHIKSEESKDNVEKESSSFDNLKTQCNNLTPVQKREMILLLQQSLPINLTEEDLSEEEKDIVEDIPIIVESSKDIVIEEESSKDIPKDIVEDIVIEDKQEESKDIVEDIPIIVIEEEEEEEEEDEDAIDEEYAHYLRIKAKDNKTPEEVEIYVKHHKVDGEYLSDDDKNFMRRMAKYLTPPQ